MNPSPTVAVAGHICLDLLPVMEGRTPLEPGKLIEAGPVSFSTGGAVANTGIALNKLGVPALLMGKVGNDHFGQILMKQLRGEGLEAVQKMIVASNDQTSYTIVLSQPGIDRTFLHCAGVNDTFSMVDIDYDALKETKVFHFGYPPLMKKMYQNNGEELFRILSELKKKDITVSLDMAYPDPDSEAGQASWKAILTKCLPMVDVFMPNIEEILYMLDRPLFSELQQKGLQCIEPEHLTRVGDNLLGMGAAIVGLKLGDNGLYIRTTESIERLKQVGKGLGEDFANWLGRELLVPCFEVKEVGTTGAGDCTIAGFLGGMVQSFSLEKTVRLAVGVGACNVEGIDATSSIPSMEKVLQRIERNWRTKPIKLNLSNWISNTTEKIWIGPKNLNRMGES
ncbi:carbohydrate kinase family protein [Bacillus sp. Marseille-Q3570]|uniref:carbohydrate kinase family protein n=1 Tax=Bacillus sp. Marseille-Q3570 TaxID=2963522 RepID=UPI0021B78FCD|nr:carbohydrate kinase family protein [Bacillus sp. Marseille-Q3570]